MSSGNTFNTMTTTTAPTVWTKFVAWIETLIDNARQGRAPNPTSQYDLECIADILGRCDNQSTQAEAVGRALYYMQLYPHLTAGQAMIIGSSSLIADSVELVG